MAGAHALGVSGAPDSRNCAGTTVARGCTDSADFCRCGIIQFRGRFRSRVRVAAAAVRYLPAIVLTQTLVSAGLWWVGATCYALYGAAASSFVSVPINAAISVTVVRSQVPFSYGELAGALQKSIVLLGLSAAGPVITLTAAGWRADLSVQNALVAVILCAMAWVCGLRLTGHPLGRDLFSAREALLKNPITARVLDAGVRLFR